MRQSGFTLLEAMVVVGILVLLLSLSFAVSTPIRVAALEQKSFSQMKAIHQGVMLYSADAGSLDELDGLGATPSGFCHYPLVVMRYGVPHSVFYSPIEPLSPTAHYATTYLFPCMIALRETGALNDDSERSRLAKEREDYPLVVDPNFDWRYYWPTEKKQDPFMIRKVELRLSISGSAKKVRVPGIRTSSPFAD